MVFVCGTSCCIVIVLTICFIYVLGHILYCFYAEIFGSHVGESRSVP